MSSSHLRVAEVFRLHWPEYLRTHAVTAEQRMTVGHLIKCRTSELGGHLYCCENCGAQVPVYNSCLDRHCPTCQTTRKEQWLEDRHAELLPAPYFHAVFTLPHQLNFLIGANRNLLLGEFFAVVSWVLQRFAADPQWKLNGQLGFVAILHTWTQKLMLHYHIHCLIPGGAWNSERQSWSSAHRTYLFSKDALAKAFQARFIKRLECLYRRRKLRFEPQSAEEAESCHWESFIRQLWQTPWIVYPKATAGNPQQALDYLARYTQRVAISDHRLLAMKDRQVRFAWRDRRDENALKSCSLCVEEFMARFVQHILPTGFRKIRYYGWLSSTNKKHALAAIRKALDASEPPPPPEETPPERILRLTGVDITACPHCVEGRLILLGRLCAQHPHKPP